MPLSYKKAQGIKKKDRGITFKKKRFKMRELEKQLGPLEMGHP